jgi:hypothetical protein
VTEPDDLVQAQDDLHQAVAEVLGRHGLMVTKWLLAAEVIDTDGGRDMQAFTSPDLRAWDSLGLLGYMNAREQGAVGAAAAREYDDAGGDEPGCE